VDSTTSGFLLAAAITILFNTALACLKDASAPLKDFMKSLAGHDWTALGLADLVIFVTLGLVFTGTKLGHRVKPDRLIGALIGSVVIAGVGLSLWFTFF